MNLELIGKVLLWAGIIAAVSALVLYKKQKRIQALAFTALSCWGIVGRGLIDFYLNAEISTRDILAMVVFGMAGLITTIVIIILTAARRAKEKPSRRSQF